MQQILEEKTFSTISENFRGNSLSVTIKKFIDVSGNNCCDYVISIGFDKKLFMYNLQDINAFKQCISFIENDMLANNANNLIFNN